MPALKSTSSVASVQIDTTPIKRLAGDLRKMAPVAAKAMRTSLKEAGEIVAEEARTKSGEWSKTIPGSIKVSTVGVSIKVKAGGTKAPTASLFENGGKAGFWRHPVFGNREVWVSQQARPFLAPALDAKAAEVEKGVTAAIGEGFRALGLDLA